MTYCQLPDRWMRRWYQPSRRACSFQRLDLALVNPGTIQTMLVEDVAAAGGTAEEWSDGDLTTVRGAQKLRDWIVMKSPRIVWFCCPTENSKPSENDHLTAAQSRSRHQSREHRIQRHMSNLASDMTSTGQCDFVLEIPWNSRAVRFGGCIHERLKGISLRLGSCMCVGFANWFDWLR